MLTKGLMKTVLAVSDNCGPIESVHEIMILITYADSKCPDESAHSRYILQCLHTQSWALDQCSCKNRPLTPLDSCALEKIELTPIR